MMGGAKDGDMLEWVVKHTFRVYQSPFVMYQGRVLGHTPVWWSYKGYPEWEPREY